MKLKSRALGALAGLLAIVTLGGTATAADRPLHGRSGVGRHLGPH